MSWNDFIDTQLLATKAVTKAMILSKDNGTVWFVLFYCILLVYFVLGLLLLFIFCLTFFVGSVGQRQILILYQKLT